MKKMISAPLALALIFSICLFMTSCSDYKIEDGYSYFGRLPAMFIGVRTNKTEYPKDNVSLNISYGWPEGYTDESGLEGYESYSVLISAYNYKALSNLPYRDPTDNYSSYFSEDNFFVLREIKDLSEEKYITKTSGTLTAKVDYSTTESLLIPEALLESLTEERSSIYLEIALIGYSEEENKYVAMYSNNIRLYFGINGDLVTINQ